MRQGTKKELAYQQLKKMFLARHFEPDTMLSENDIARGLGMSRTPVREALQLLQSEGFVDIYPKQGIMFKGMSTSTIHEILELRAAIEGYAAAASLPYSEGQLTRLDELMDNQLASCGKGDIEEYLQHDFIFHSYFIELYNNSLISEVFRSINDRFMSVGFSILRSVRAIEESFASHQTIVAAIKDSDAPAVLKSLHDHIEFGKRQLYLWRSDGMERLPVNGRAAKMVKF